MFFSVFWFKSCALFPLLIYGKGNPKKGHFHRLIFIIIRVHKKSNGCDRGISSSIGSSDRKHKLLPCVTARAARVFQNTWLAKFCSLIKVALPRPALILSSLSLEFPKNYSTFNFYRVKCFCIINHFQSLLYYKGFLNLLLVAST